MIRTTSVGQRRCVFLDRDGVLIKDVDLLTTIDQISIYDGVAESLGQLRAAGFQLVVVSNQAVVARGMATESDVEGVHLEIQRRLESRGGGVDAWYFCPHHPNATLPEYRQVCACRKPSPGMIHDASNEFGIDPSASFMIGDRMTDIVAGATANCRTILVETGKHGAPPIESSKPVDRGVIPDFRCASLADATRWILEGLH